MIPGGRTSASVVIFYLPLGHHKLKKTSRIFRFSAWTFPFFGSIIPWDNGRINGNHLSASGILGIMATAPKLEVYEMGWWYDVSCDPWSCLCACVFLMGWFEVYEMGWFLALVLLHPKPSNHNEDIQQRSIFVHSLVMIWWNHMRTMVLEYAHLTFALVQNHPVL